MPVSPERSVNEMKASVIVTKTTSGDPAVRVVLCGTTASGETIPVMVDASGRLVVVSE